MFHPDISRASRTYMTCQPPASSTAHRSEDILWRLQLWFQKVCNIHLGPNSNKDTAKQMCHILNRGKRWWEVTNSFIYFLNWQIICWWIIDSETIVWFMKKNIDLCVFWTQDVRCWGIGCCSGMEWSFLYNPGTIMLGHKADFTEWIQQIIASFFSKELFTVLLRAA